MKNKIISALLSLFVILSPFSVSAKIGDVKYLDTGEEYDYGSNTVWLMADKATGKIIPLSWDEYAYMPYDGEIERVKIAPVEFTDTNEYTDVGLPEDIYFVDMYVNEMSARGVLTGYGDGTFRPAKELTRAEMAAVFCRMFQIQPSDKQSCFSDVKNTDWCCGYIMALVDKGVFKKDEKFNPDDKITREQLTAMTYRMLCDMDYAPEEIEYDFSTYKDMDSISEYAKKPYTDLISNGYHMLMKTDNHDEMDYADDEDFLEPQRSVTRYECAEFLYYLVRNFIDNNAPATKRDGAPDAEIPILDGSTSTYNITQNIYWQYYINSQNHPDFPKAHSKTSNSYKRLIDGEVEMIFVPDPSDEVKSYAEEKGVTLKYIPIANEALIFFTDKNNHADNITTEQLHNIYVNNSIKNWSEIGGSDAELVPFCRNLDSGSHAQMEKFILDGKDLNEEIRKEHTSWIMSSILTEVDAFNRENAGKYAMGYSLYYYYFNNQTVLGPVNLKLMSINGVAPTDDTIANGEYPYTTNYYAVIRDEENPKVDAFAELLQGDFGREIMAMSGMGARIYTEN